MPKGIILKGIGGFYYVKTSEGVIECKARGKFRKRDMIPMVGDRVDISIAAHDATKGSIEHIDPRRTQLIRPPVSNVDQAVIVVSVTSPNPNLVLVDKFLVAAENQKLDIILCFNKIDLDESKAYVDLFNIYAGSGYGIVGTSSVTGAGINELRNMLEGKITVFAGASGVGKSSLLNAVDPRFSLQTGEISQKIKRGRHTTRHVELLALKDGSYVVDTPGFSSMDLTNIRKEELQYLFKEFTEHIPLCRFRGCAHTSEPGCSVLEALDKNKISASRYNNYLQFYNQLKDIKEWQR
ncbi:MAG: ribosome small subunit-dependent GTPase A [Firmicutes bacterium]|nr:ribosome small subunit-dependent GTPase A [Bacillota bacterium]